MHYVIYPPEYKEGKTLNCRANSYVTIFAYQSRLACQHFISMNFLKWSLNWPRLLVCTWRHGGHGGGQEQKLSSPLGTKHHFHVNSLRKNVFVLTPNKAALLRGYKPRIDMLHCCQQVIIWSANLSVKTRDRFYWISVVRFVECRDKEILWSAKPKW